MRKVFENSIDKENLLLIFFFMIVIGDALTKIFFSVDGWNASKYIKAFLLLPLIILSYKNQKKLFVYLSISFLLFYAGTLSVSADRFIKNIPQFFEYYFFVLFFTAFLNIKYKGLGPALEVVFLLHALFIILASLFEYKFLKTYTYSKRLGYISFFNSQNEFSYVIMAGIAFFAAKMKHLNFIGIIKVLFMLAAGFLVGTKAIVIFAFTFGGYFLLFKTKPKVFIPILVTLSSLILIFRDQLTFFFKTNYETLYTVYETQGFLSFLSSKRTVLVWDRLKNNSENIDVINYLFGGYDLQNLFEMSFLDILFFFGFIGTLLYGFILYRFVLKKITLDVLLKVYLSLIVAISMVSGYFFENASAQIYTLLVVMFLSGCKGESATDFERKKEKINA
jgi:hypothetical protein